MTLRSVYEDTLTSTRDPALLAERAGVTVKSAKTFLRDEASAQVSRQRRKPTADNYAPTGAPQGYWQADVIYLEDYKGVNMRRKAILTVLNTTTRFAHARPLLDATAERVAEAMSSILDNENSIKALRIDGGSEFKKEFRVLMRTRGIPLEVGEPYTHYRLARTDRFHRTLRKRIGEHFARDDTHQWVEALPAIVTNYNNTPHHTLSGLLGEPTAPNQVTLAQEARIRLAEGQQVSDVQHLVDDLNIVPGVTKVRVPVSITKAGIKSGKAKSQRAVWSKAFTVLSRNGPNSFVVDVPRGEVKIFPHYNLQVEPETTVPLPVGHKGGPKVNIRVERAKRLENRNISEEEQVAALVAPAREKRESILTPKMAALKNSKASKLSKAALVVVDTNKRGGLPKAALAAPARPRSQRAARVDYKTLAGLK